VAVAIKFCGLSRPTDALCASALGADYVGVVFAESPRRVTVETALAVRETLGDGPDRPHLVGVFGGGDPETIATTGRTARLDVIQLHADPDAQDVRRVRQSFDGEVWAAVRVSDMLPENFDAISAAADAVLLDCFSTDALGGSGRRFDWARIATELRTRRRPARVVVGGGLTAENVSEAIRALSPDIVDVSSGVERAPGEKDQAKMRAFAEAVRTSAVATG
jgi:phosphoribosylanthranilate isomerase